MAESFYTSLASGDPTKIQQASAPATEAIAKNFENEKKAIGNEMPRGGARDLALQEADISKAGAIGGTEANAFLGSFPALASLAGQGVGLSINEVTQALSALGGASSSNQAFGQMQGTGKAQTLGFLGGLGQSAAVGAGTAIGCWIAESVYGKNSLHTVRLRVWLNQVYGKTRTGRVVMWFYLRFGKFVARQVEKRSWVRRLFTRVFTYADRKAYQWELGFVQQWREAGVI